MSPPDSMPIEGARLAVPPVFRGISARLASVIALLIGFGIAAAAGVHSVARFAERAVAEVSEVGRLRMYTKALTLEAVRPGSDAGERVRRFDDQAKAVDAVFARLAVSLGQEARLDGSSLPQVVSLEGLRAGWGSFRERGRLIAAGETPDPLFYVAERDMLSRAEALVDAMVYQAGRTRDHYLMLIALGLILGVGLSGFMFHLIRKRLIVPALELSEASRRLAAGDLAARVRVRTHDEIGMLGRAFNESAARLAAAQTSLRQHEAALRDSEQRYRSLWETSTDGIVIIDAQSTICFANPSVGRMLGHAPEDMAGRPITMIQPPERREAHRQGFRRYLATGERRENWGAISTRALHADGHEIDVEVSFSRFELADGPRFAAFFRDITERRRAEAALRFSATHDALTGLPNRVLFVDRLEQAIRAAERSQEQLAVAFLDLDNFKMLNDGLGHDLGDCLLIEVAERLRAAVGESTTVARLGSDEFVMLFPALTRATPVAETGERVLAAIGQPIAAGGDEVFVGGSIGVALYPRDGGSADTLLRNAGIAMQRAKEEGRRNLQFFTDGLQERVTRRMSVESALRRAADNGDFELHFQPQFAIDGERIVGAEALIRWRHASRGLIAPAEFIPIAEECGLIVPIGAWVIDAACAEMRRWEACGITGLRAAINLSSRQFRDKPLLSTIERALARHGIDALGLEVELTESAVMHDPEDAGAILARMKELGLTVSLDDFGTGYSSLAYLKRFPIDILKIDRSFVKDTPTDADDARIAGAIISLSHGLGLKVIAEGVETREQLEFLRGAGCDMLQGFLLARPMPGDDFRAFVAQRPVK